MWDYTEKVVDHFKNPRNVGVVENPDGEAIVGSLACGDSLKFSFKLDADKKYIEEAKFQTFGCASAIASASALTEMVKGKTIDEIKKITNDDIVSYLGGLPTQKIHCSVMGEEVLQEAIKDYEKRYGLSSTPTADKDIVCRCFNVSRKDIVDIVEKYKVSNIDDLQKYSKAGTGCGACREKLAAIIEECRKKN